MDFDYNNILGRLKFVLGKDASFFADTLVRRNDIIWSTKERKEYESLASVSENERQILKERFGDRIAQLSAIISEDTLLGPHVQTIMSFPSEEFIYYYVDGGIYNFILTGWGCSTTEKEIMEEPVDKNASEDSNVSEESDVDSDVVTASGKDNVDDVGETESVQRDEDDKLEEESAPVAEDELEEKNLDEHAYSSEWLKQNTHIRGWLSFFLFAIAVGGLVSAVYPIATFDSADYAGDMWLGAVDILTGVFLLGIALYTVYAFNTRKPNAVFYARLYVVLIIVTNIVTLLSGDDTEFGGVKQSIRGIVWGVVWFFYLLLSKQIKEVIPKSFRKISKTDWGILCAIIIIPILCLAIGLFNLSSEVENRERNEKEILEVPLADNERTDGRIIFTIPEGFDCDSEVVEPIQGTQITLFSLKNDLIGNCTICSDYDRDKSTSNFDEYWKSWEGEDDKICPKTNVDRGSKDINGHYCMYRIIRYNVNGVHVYWRYYIMFDDSSGKCCVVSCYDTNKTTMYVENLLSSIRFK